MFGFALGAYWDHGGSVVAVGKGISCIFVHDASEASSNSLEQEVEGESMSPCCQSVINLEQSKDRRQYGVIITESCNEAHAHLREKSRASGMM